MPNKIDLGTLKLKRVIVHDIPQHKKGQEGVSPQLSKNVSELPGPLRGFFREKILQALKSEKSLKVSFKIDGETSPVEETVKLLATDNPDFISCSHELGRHLFRIQVGNNAGGILLVIECSVHDQPSTIIMKLERDNGAQLTLDPETDSFNIVEVKDLMLTQKTRIFKVALLFDRKLFDVDFDGQVTDYQINIKNKMKATSFFIDDYLGCEASAEPKVYTQRFYKHTKDFIDQIDDPIKKTKYLNDLNSYIQKNDTVIIAKSFAEDYLETAVEKDRYKKHLQAVKYPFEASILKDTQLIDSKIRKIAVDFVNGISIVGTKGIIDKNVTIEDYEKGETKGHRAEIISKISGVS